MENVSCHYKDGILSVLLKGRVDSVNAGSVERAIADGQTAYPSEHILLDCENLEYISSAGLRVILRLKKAIKDTRIVNASPDVYEVFEITGFTEMMDIQKGYRTVSVDDCELIGRGANGKVYRIDRDTIVKVYLNPDALPEIQRERELARTAFVLGVPTAIPYDVVRIKGGGYGSVFELLNAKSLAQLLQTGEKTVDEAAQMSIDLLKTIHATVVSPDSMPDMKSTALDWADYLKDYLPMDHYKKLRSLIEDIPDDDHMIHGDYHIKNVMLQDDECLLIDMDTLCHGHPVFELASMFNAYHGYLELDDSMSMAFLGIPTETAEALWQKELRLYFSDADEKSIRMIEDKAKILGYARILRRRIRRNGLSSESGRAEIASCKRHLAELLPRVDSLVF